MTRLIFSPLKETGHILKSTIGKSMTPSSLHPTLKRAVLNANPVCDATLLPALVHSHAFPPKVCAIVSHFNATHCRLDAVVFHNTTNCAGQLLLERLGKSWKYPNAG